MNNPVSKVDPNGHDFEIDKPMRDARGGPFRKAANGMLILDSVDVSLEEYLAAAPKLENDLGVPLEFTDGQASGQKSDSQAKQSGSQAQGNQNACQSGSCDVKVIGDTGSTPSPFVPGVVQREITYQAVDSSVNQ